MSESISVVLKILGHVDDCFFCYLLVVCVNEIGSIRVGWWEVEKNLGLETLFAPHFRAVKSKMGDFDALCHLGRLDEVHGEENYWRRSKRILIACSNVRDVGIVLDDLMSRSR